MLGAICAAIASSKQRNAVGWFFIGFLIGCIGLIIILCLSNLGEEQERWSRSQREQRRLKEQLKQERLKNQTFQANVRNRLDVHDEALGLDTRELAGSHQSPNLLEEGSPSERDVRSAPTVSFPARSSFQSLQWYCQIGTRQSKPMDLTHLRMLFQSGKVDERNLVWAEGMQDWKPISQVPGLLEDLA